MVAEEDTSKIKNGLEKFLPKDAIYERIIWGRIKKIEEEFGIKATPFSYDPKLDKPEERPKLTFFSLQEQLKNLQNKACDLAVSQLGLPEKVIDPTTGKVVDSQDSATRLKIYRQMISAKIKEAEKLGIFVPYYDLGSSEKLPPYSARRLMMLTKFQKNGFSKEEYLRQQNLYWQENDPKFSNKPTPILEGETFDPEEELQKVWKVKGRKRRDAFNVFKAKLAYQLEGWANLRQRLLQDISFDPDISKEELEDILSAYKQRYGFSGNGVKLARSFFQEYLRKRSLIKKIPEMFESPEDFCQKFSGIRPEGKVEMLVKGISVILKFYDRKDFLEILKTSLTITHGKNRTTLPGFELTTGALLVNTRISYLNGHIIVLDASSPDLSATLAHEEQHVVYNFLSPLEEKNMPNFGIFPRTYKDAEKETLDESKKILREYLEKERKRALLLAKDEIFARKKDNRFDSSKILNLLTAKSIELYDFTWDLRKKLTDNPITLGKLEFFSIYNLTKRILLEEYYLGLKEAINAFDDLIRQGFSVEQAIGLLTPVAPWKWKRSVKMILEERKNPKKDPS